MNKEDRAAIEEALCAAARDGRADPDHVGCAYADLLDVRTKKQMLTWLDEYGVLLTPEMIELALGRASLGASA